MDFRNKTVISIENHFKSLNFNQRGINNFKKAFRNQEINTISDLTGIKNIAILSDTLPFNKLTLVESFTDKDKNEKFVFKTYDNLLIESVLMPFKKNISICVSVQAGCKLGCIICNTGKMGFIRSLFTHEILEQIRQINILRIIPERLSCISFMGMGEPFDNLENCMKALEWIETSWGWQISRKKITFSTSGCIKFDDFLSYTRLPNLAVSLHSADYSKRKKILPYANLKLNELKKYLIMYTFKTKKQISIEYCLIKNFNDSKKDAELLVDYLKQIPCKVNLMNYNTTKGTEFESLEYSEIMNFKTILENKGIPVIYRKSLGIDIGAGCGQLGGRIQ